MKNLIKEDLNKMKYLLGYQRGMVMSEQELTPAVTAPASPAATPQTVEDVIKQIQTVLKSKYNANLGNSGTNEDGIDGKWGNLTQTAFENAAKSKSVTPASTKVVPSRSEDVTKLLDTAATSQLAQAAPSTTLQVPAGVAGVAPVSQTAVPAPVVEPVTAPVAAPALDIYSTLVKNKTLLRRGQNAYVYKGADLTSPQKQELESKLLGMGFRLSTVRNDFRAGDKLVFKRN